MTNSMLRMVLFTVVLLSSLGVAGTPVYAEDFPSDIWREIPVYHHGRVKPMDAYARQVVQKITEFNKSKPRFNLVDYYTEEELKQPEMQAALEIFPEGKERKFTPDELIFEWSLRPEAWERVPFIYLGREDVREELGLPINSPGSVKLNFVSPHQVATSVKLREYINGMHQREMKKGQGESEDKQPLDAYIWKGLVFRYAVYREVSLDPRLPVISTPPIALSGARDRFFYQVQEANMVLDGGGERPLYSQLQTLQQIAGEHPLSLGATHLLGSIQELTELARESIVRTDEVLGNKNPTPVMPADPLSTKELEPLVKRFREDAAAMERVLEEQRDTVNKSTTLSEREYNNIKPMFQSMLVYVRQLEHIGLETNLALYENPQTAATMDRVGNYLQIVPALNPYALSKSRNPSDLAQPWLGLTTVLYGSEDLLQPYNMSLINAVRSDWEKVRQAYLAGGETKGSGLRDAMQKLSDDLHRLGEANNTERKVVLEETLGPDEVDSGILAYTAYPPVDSYRIATEVRYNTLDPFMYAWIFTFIATLGFGLAFTGMRKAMFWTGVTFLLIGIVWSTYGFYMRVVVTGWAPVTNMYETVIFVPWVVCALGLMFLLLPIYDRGRLAAWRATAIPGIWEAAELTEAQREMFPSNKLWLGFNVVAAILRLPVTLFIAYALVALPFYDGNRPIINFDSVNFGGSVFSIVQGLVISVILVGTTVLTAWYLPRLVISAILMPLFCLYDWFAVDKKLSDRFEKTYDRTYYGLAAAACGTFLLCVASIAPIVDTGTSRVLNAEFSPLQPVLRSNVWLTIHVLTIVASYGAGILAWGLGWLALGYYMFGKYRAPVVASTLNEGLAPKHAHTPQMSYRPPEQCFILGQQCYRAIQVAVLLLATGTILGGIWADVSWGRFWGWDPKEVWALVTLLIYVAILHARFAGWFNNFGLVVGTIIGFSSIVGSWYGVNFLLPLFKGGDAVGLHSYGSGGKGSEILVMGFVAANWIGLGLVALRFQLSKLSVVDENDVEEVVIKTDLPDPKDTSNLGDIT
ncbi:cytochrome c biogenesis protein [Bremerella cremea]|nr:cytochrome c biogenesis protein CcsA [Bremerella cremea]